MTETTITSFIVRFLQERLAEGDVREGPWRGVVRHVQSRQEARFTIIEEALQFMSQYINLETAGGVSRMAHVNGIRLHYLDYAAEMPGRRERPVIIFLTGLTATAHLVEGLIAAGLNRRHRVISIDWRGRGRSEKPERGYSMGEHAADVMALLEHLGLEEVVLCGLSFGGLIGFYIAANSPDWVRRLVVLDSSILPISERTLEMVQAILDGLKPRLPSMEDYIGAMRQAPFLRGFWHPLLEAYYRSDVQVHKDGSVQKLARPEAIAETIEMQFREPWDAYLSSIRQPVLLVNALEPFGPEGAQPILPLDMAQETVNSLADCQYVQVPGNHMTMLYGDNARAVGRAIDGFLE